MNHTKYDREAQDVKPAQTWEDKRADEFPGVIIGIFVSVLSVLVANGIADWAVGVN